MTDKQVKEEKEATIIRLVSQFCNEHINEEYSQLCVALTKKLGRKRNVPFMTGSLDIWAASIVYTVGALNFLFDKSAKPYISSNDIHEFFGTKSSTVTGKSKIIRDLLKLSQFNNEFATKSMIRSNPFHRITEMFSAFVMVDDRLCPIEDLPEELQQMVKESRAKGKDISFKTNM
jgi:hypothetical protein